MLTLAKELYMFFYLNMARVPPDFHFPSSFRLLIDLGEVK